MEENIDRQEADAFLKLFDHTLLEGTKTINEVAKHYLVIFSTASTLVVAFRDRVFTLSETKPVLSCTDWISMVCWLIAIISATMVIYPNTNRVTREYFSIKRNYEIVVRDKKNWLALSTIAFILALFFTLWSAI
jgi:hypothetical protein